MPLIINATCDQPDCETTREYPYGGDYGDFLMYLEECGWYVSGKDDIITLECGDHPPYCEAGCGGRMVPSDRKVKMASGNEWHVTACDRCGVEASGVFPDISLTPEQQEAFWRLAMDPAPWALEPRADGAE